ncbi:hypothetical protein C8A01DRAFT_45967 [Parachaetomium inaequale]|uniref:Calcineurin-like phosphoesterase domain-containing protein n=1 Tax=Parachaetomium inaequale TaxID=2588326 RepID=A0AAN6PLM0_9PEZI|nr:hypothetical protein C8A01DRAFT_45967 [Parachaetomium inaequale]
MATQPITRIKTRGHQRRRLASAILAWHHPVKTTTTSPPADPIRVVCISDTHNHQPVLPAGDILIHAGDLTENGSFAEVQAGITWLSSQPHRFKILVAGNHDVLFDEAFLQRYPERRYGQSQTKRDLDWGGVIYLEDESITLNVPVWQQHSPTDTTAANISSPQPQPTTNTRPPGAVRRITIFGSPWTPLYGISAFQYPRSTGISHWPARLDNDNVDRIDILITHGPPHLYLDRRDIHRAGCPYLLAEVSRLRPRLHVFGHIHVAHGREDVVLDGVRQAHDDVQVGWGGWGAVGWMVVLVVWARVRVVFNVIRGEERGRGRTPTTFVNASVVGGRGNEVRNGAVVVEI